MNVVQSSAQVRAQVVRMVDVDHLLARLQALRRHQLVGGFNSHAHGVRLAIELVERDLSENERGASDAPHARASDGLVQSVADGGSIPPKGGAVIRT